MATIDTKALVASAESRARHSDGVTLVAAYGDEKPRGFAQVVSDLTTRCTTADGLAGWIRTYERAQIHATIVGLEGTRRGDAVIQEHASARLGGAGRGGPMDFGAMLEFLASSASDLPVVAGGFREDDRNPFDPERTPFERSFDIRSDGLVVAMGWPHAEDRIEPHLVELRKRLEAFHVVHKYHRRPEEQDNDLFFVIGELDVGRWGRASSDERAAAQRAIDTLVAQCRQDLSRRRYPFTLAPRDFHIVKYQRTSLAEVSFASRVTEVDAETLLGLYSE